MFTSIREKKLSPLFQVAHVASKQANIQLWQKSVWWLFLFILQRPLQRSRSHKKELCALNKFCQKPREGAEPGSCWNCHLQWARIPKGAGFLFMLSPYLFYPKTDTKIRQLLPLPTPTLHTLRAPLNLTAGPSTSVCYTATLRAAQGPGSVEAGLRYNTFCAIHLIYKLRSRQ